MIFLDLSVSGQLNIPRGRPSCNLRKATAGSIARHERNALVDGEAVVVAGVHLDLGYVELHAVEAIVPQRLRLLVDEPRVGVCAPGRPSRTREPMRGRGRG